MLENTLEDWISSRKKIKNVKSILQQITAWLKKHHNSPNDNVHGELTPDHIYLNEKGKKVMDIKLKNLTTDSSLQNNLGWRPAEETNLSPSQEGDIFSLGCLFYYVISSGGHPFGCYPKHRKIFITYHLYELGCYQLGNCNLDDVQILQIRNLISMMIHYDPKKRPTCSEVLKHPFFSGNKKTGLDSTSDDEHDSEKVGDRLIIANKTFGFVGEVEEIQRRHGRCGRYHVHVMKVGPESLQKLWNIFNKHHQYLLKCVHLSEDDS